MSATPSAVAIAAMDDAVTYWAPGDYLSDQAETNPLNLALIILNQPILDTAGFVRLWRNARLRVCADGGANHLYNTPIDGYPPVPDCITGDLDSIKTNVGLNYRALGVPIIPNRSQDATDFTKSLNWIVKEESRLQAMAGAGEDFASLDDAKSAPHDATGHPNACYPMDVVAYGATGGRVDQSFHAIDQLFRNSDSRASGQNSDTANRQMVLGSPSSSPPPSSYRKLILVTGDSVTFLLERGRNIIETPAEFFGKTCGLIPVDGPSVITTKGLEWDLTETETRFGGMVSTSNHLTGPRVEVVTTQRLLFTMALKCPLPPPRQVMI